MKENKTIFWKGLLGGVIGSLLVLFLVVYTGFTGLLNPQGQLTVSSQTTNEATQSVFDFEATITQAIEKTGDAVVSIHNLQPKRQMQNLFQNGYFGSTDGRVDLQNPEETLEVAGSGSGVVYKIDGGDAYIVTNYHVIENQSKLEVITANDETVDAQLIGGDLFTDLAVLKIDASYVNTVMEFGDSDQAKVGSLAIAIGSPIGSEFSSSVTQGIISGVNRILPFDFNNDGVQDWEMSLIQTDAAINPGNSGGALVNKHGELVGINSSKLSASGIEGMGFAIPSNEVKKIIAELESNGKVIRPLLGIQGDIYSVSDLSVRSKVDILNLPQDADKGIVVVTPSPGGAAQKAGLEQYDVITAINGEEVNDLMNLRQQIYRYAVGDTVEVSIIRQGQPMTLEVTLEATPE